jgi:Ca-activated chloride channel family protein
MKSNVSLVFLLSIFVFSALPQLAQEKSRPGDAPAKKQRATAGNKEQDRDEDVIRIRTNLVTVPVTVLNKEGKYLQNLRRSDFHVYEDNVEQEVSFFSDNESPLGIVLLIDTSDSVGGGRVMGWAVDALIDQLRPNDTVFPIAFDSLIRAPLSKSTSDKVLLHKTSRELSKPSDGSGGTRIFDTIEFINKHLLPAAGGRKVVIVFSDGCDSGSRIGTRKGTLHDVTELGAPYYTFGYYSSAYSTLRSFMGDEWFNKLERARMDGQRYLWDLAERSGGRSSGADGQFPDTIKNAFAALGNELVHQYFISYYPKSSTASNQRRQIKIRVDPAGAKVHARSSYIYEPLDK